MNLGECLPDDGRGYASREEAEAEAEAENLKEERRQGHRNQHDDEDWATPEVRL